MGLASTMVGCLPMIEKILPGSKPIKNVVFLTMNGGVSQIETFDYKPDLYKYDGKSISIPDNENPYSILVKPKVSFKQYGQSGAWVSSVFPALSEIVDKLSFVKTCQNFSPAHFEAVRYLFTGSNLNDQPSIMSWLGHLTRGNNKKLPASITMFDSLRPFPPFSEGSLANYFLPDYTKSYHLEEELLNFMKKPHLGYRTEELTRNLLNRLNNHSKLKYHKESIERNLAFYEHKNFQNELEKSLQIQKEPEHIKKLYALDDPDCANYARKLLKARRLLEQGVKVINIHSGGFGLLGWDSHKDFKDFFKITKEVDKPIAGFIKDLEQRGLLEETLVVFWTEFGRLPCQESLSTDKNSKNGRDHNLNASTIWFAGGGVKPGQSIGQTDELSYKSVEDIYNVHDLHHTIFKLAGFDLNDFQFKHEGKTKVFFKEKGRMIKGLL